MAYLSAMQKLAAPSVGTAPQPRAPSIGVPPVQAHIEPAPYDVAMDPGWKGVLDPNDHELRNFLNGLSPEERQMLLTRVGKIGGAGSPSPPMPPVAIPQGA